jgi:hypothetical protein
MGTRFWSYTVICNPLQTIRFPPSTTRTSRGNTWFTEGWCCVNDLLVCELLSVANFFLAAQ